MPAPTFGSVGTPNANNQYTDGINVDVPDNVAANSVILVAITIGAGSATITPPSGMTLVPGCDHQGPDGTRHLVYQKRATGADTGTYGFTWTGAFWGTAHAARYEGVVSTGDTLDGVNSVIQSTANDLAPAVSVTTTTADVLLVYIPNSNFGPCTWTHPTGFTEDADDPATGQSFNSKTQATAGASGNVQATLVGGNNSNHVSSTLLALRSIAGTPDPSWVNGGRSGVAA